MKLFTNIKRNKTHNKKNHLNNRILILNLEDYTFLMTNCDDQTMYVLKHLKPTIN